MSRRSEHPIDVEKADQTKPGTGVAGRDDVLGGSLTLGDAFLLGGSPGTGKTTIALRFLLEGAAAGEQRLYTALSETEKELRLLMGWTLDAGVKV